MPRGRLIVFEGIDGTGKTTQVQRLKQYLQGAGVKMEAYREPGGTDFGEHIRKVLLAGKDYNEELAPETEFLLFAAVRRELCRQVLAPKLDDGVDIILDRFRDSSVAYQGYGRGVDLEFIERVNNRVTGAIEPDVTILMDMEVERALQRIERSTDRIEQGGLEFFRRVRDGYLEIAATLTGEYLVVDADRDEDIIFCEIKNSI